MRAAIIREDVCVGCAKCLDVCPVDAIVGSSKFLHTVLKEECIGCELCLPPCPMDCIEMIDAEIEDRSSSKLNRAKLAKQRYLAKQQRLQRKQKTQLLYISQDPEYKLKIRNEISAAVSRIKARKKDEFKTTA